MIVQITAEELAQATRSANAGLLPTLHDNLEIFRNHIPNVMELLSGFEQSFNVMRQIIETGESREFNNARGGVTVVNPVNAVEEIAMLALYTVMLLTRVGDDNLVAQLGANMRNLYDLVSPQYSTMINIVEEPELAEDITEEELDEDITEEELDEDTTEEDLDEDPFEEFTDEDLELLLDDELEPEEDSNEEEEKARERERIARELLASFVTLEDDGSNKVDEKFPKRENDPEYYEDIRRPHDWQQNLSINRNFRVGLKINEGDSVELVGWNNNEE